jgi:hypothetical protein
VHIWNISCYSEHVRLFASSSSHNKKRRNFFRRCRHRSFYICEVKIRRKLLRRDRPPPFP